jgi:hypothetical protein
MATRRTLLQRGSRFDRVRAQLLRRERVLERAGRDEAFYLQDATYHHLYRRLVDEARVVWMARDTAA